jgi:transcriptional regulator with XRE-family HTH domain
MSKTLRSRGHRALIAVIVATRREKALTQRQLADKLKKPHSYISKIEAGERRLDVVEFIALAQALGVEPETLFRRVVRW